MLLKGRRSTRIWGFFSGGIFELSQFLPQKAPKIGLLQQKSAVLLEFCQSSSLIESGPLFARIRYVPDLEAEQNTVLLLTLGLFKKSCL